MRENPPFEVRLRRFGVWRAAIAAALSLVRVPGGVLACRERAWSIATDAGRAVAGPLTVALDWGVFLLLRIDCGRDRVWLPVQRRGLERDRHSSRCALYSSPGPAATPPRTVPPAE